VAVSGGPDSTALLFLLNDVREALGVSLSACHLNHCLRGGESDRDEDFARKLADRLSIPIKVETVNVAEKKKSGGGSTQSVARELRYAFFHKLLDEGFAQKIAVGHTADDSAETVLMNFLRGSGAQGLAGIPPMRGKRIIRPLIETPRREILTYLSEKGLEYRIDSSNKSSSYLRNRVRNELIPQLESEYNPALRENLLRLSSIMKDIQTFLSAEAEKEFNSLAADAGDGVQINAAGLISLSTALQREVLRLAIEKLKGNSLGVSFDHMEDLRRLIIRGKSGELDLPGMRICLSEGEVRLSAAGSPESSPFSYGFTHNSIVYITEIGLHIESKKVSKDERYADKSCKTVFVDADRLPADTVIRSRREGDRFHPLGGVGSKKLKKFLIDAGIPRWQRGRLPLLASGSDILWIAGVRLSDRIKIRPETESVLRLELKKEATPEITSGRRP
jgi:tRNA(Ile)-lysidine synthase